MKHLKRIGLGILCTPVALIALFILFETVGMCVNHIATGIQTKRLKQNLEAAVDDITIIDAQSETGNASGTGNHVDSVSVVTFQSGKSLDALIGCMAAYYDFDEWLCRIDETDAGYQFYLNTPAPFADNIEGH